MLRQTLYYLGIKNNPSMSEDALRRLQLSKFRRLVRHACETTEFYRELYEQSEVGPQAIESLDDLARLPIINKDIVNRAGQSIISDKYPVASLIKEKTSGTTGVPIVLYRSKASKDITGAAKYRIDTMNGFRPWMKTAYWYLPGIKKYKKFSHFLGLNRQEIISPDMSLKEQVAILQKQQPEAYYCYPSQLIRVARYILDNEIHGIHPKLVILHSENSQLRVRETIAKCFGVNPVNVYGAREFGTVAWEGGTSDCRGLHTNADLLYVEIVDPDSGQRVGEGESGNIVITDFTNLARPLIRYDTHDVATATYLQCGCGISFPMIKEIHGRSGETVILPSGEEHTLDFGVGILIRAVDVIEQYQILITSENSLLIKVKTTGNVKFNESELTAKIGEHCGGVGSEIQYVASSDDFTRAPSGKFLDIVRETNASPD
jgi:phenylacetate-CoA ligase